MPWGTRGGPALSDERAWRINGGTVGRCRRRGSARSPDGSLPADSGPLDWRRGSRGARCADCRTRTRRSGEPPVQPRRRSAGATTTRRLREQVKRSWQPSTRSQESLTAGGGVFRCGRPFGAHGVMVARRSAPRHLGARARPSPSARRRTIRPNRHGTRPTPSGGCVRDRCGGRRTARSPVRWGADRAGDPSAGQIGFTQKRLAVGREGSVVRSTLPASAVTRRGSMRPGLPSAVSRRA